ncbi:alpha/beta hydrolase [Paenibacillus sp. UASWS1643]|uniref:alpha/beta hydrolase n=1 Tax=Paenibacillus sp. UASWS1643 TaxID=2580422 RepID=UPI00123C6A41|nr:alpha/beta hydrolase [Paenibacillus sp. UASWS1643]KAA8745370.1 alpha/beta hydrolase [Paenibacillus sp. UASWS1643]
MKNKVRVYAVLAGLVIILLTWSQSFFINYVIPLGVAAIAVSLVNGWVIKKHSEKKVQRMLIGLTTLFLVVEILWMLIDHIVLFVIAQSTFALIGLTLLGLGLGIQANKKRNFPSVIAGIGKWVFLLGLLLITSSLLLFTVTPKPVTLYLQSTTGAKNTYQAEPSTTTIVDDKYQLISNIQYGEKYPRSFLYIITPSGQFDEKRPTYFYVHGGGFIFGDAMGGDPNAGSAQNLALYQYEKMIDQGYNVVTINYAYAPQYVHPTPIKQLSEAVEFMQKNGAQYGINMQDVVFAGGSAGGHIAAEFTTIQANRGYAEEIGIDPIIELENIKAVVLESAPFDATRGHKTVKEDVVIDYTFGQSLGAYFDLPVVSADKEKLEQLNLIPKATNNFPPTFISDGNTGTFADQAEDYYNRLKELGVKTDLYIPDIKEGAEGHGFMVQNIESKAAKTYLDRKFDFLESLD